MEKKEITVEDDLKVWLATALAEARLFEEMDENEAVVNIEDSSEETKYTEVAQKIFNNYYDYYYERL